MAKISFTFSGSSSRPLSLFSDIGVTSCFLVPEQAGPCIWGNRVLVTTSRRFPRRPDRSDPSTLARTPEHPASPALGCVLARFVATPFPASLDGLGDLGYVAIPFLEEGRDDVLRDVVLQSRDDEVRGDGTVLRVE